jgi:hypothetical protein
MNKATELDASNNELVIDKTTGSVSLLRKESSRSGKTS